MDWALIGPILISLAKNMASGLATNEPPTPVRNVPAGTVKVPSRAIKDLQKLLNAVVKPQPPLDVDGWLGPRTEEAIEAGIAKLKAAGIG